MSYPSKISVILPIFARTPATDRKAYGRNYVYLRAYGLLNVARADDGTFSFHHDVQIDPVGNQSISLLTKLCAQLELDTCLAGWKLDEAVAGLIRVPRDSDGESQAKEPLMRLLLALSAEPIDVSWLSPRNGMDLLEAIASDLSLPAEWDVVPALANPVRVRQQLAARVQTIWFAIAEDRMNLSDARLARMALRLHTMGGAMA
jgi:hypothetical protein